MAKTKITLAYCTKNKVIIAEIMQSLVNSNFEFHPLNCKDVQKGETSLGSALGLQQLPGLLIITDDFLKSVHCMYDSLKLLQDAINNNKIIPVVADGSQYDDKTGKSIHTSIEKVGDVIQYMNFWQDKYLEVRKQKREIPPEQAESFNARLKKIRSISSEVGEFLRHLRNSDYIAYDELKADSFKQMFLNFSDLSQHLDFKNKASYQPFTPPFVTEPKPETPSVPREEETLKTAAEIGGKIDEKEVFGIPEERETEIHIQEEIENIPEAFSTPEVPDVVANLDEPLIKEEVFFEKEDEIDRLEEDETVEHVEIVEAKEEVKEVEVTESDEVVQADDLPQKEELVSIEQEEETFDVFTQPTDSVEEIIEEETPESIVEAGSLDAFYDKVTDEVANDIEAEKIEVAAKEKEEETEQLKEESEYDILNSLFEDDEPAESEYEISQDVEERTEPEEELLVEVKEKADIEVFINEEEEIDWLGEDESDEEDMVASDEEVVVDEIEEEVVEIVDSIEKEVGKVEIVEEVKKVEMVERDEIDEEVKEEIVEKVEIDEEVEGKEILEEEVEMVEAKEEVEEDLTKEEVTDYSDVIQELLEESKEEEAMRLMAETLESDKDNTDIRSLYAFYLARNAGNYEEALEHVKYVLEKEPKNEKTLFLAGEISELKGDNKAAYKYYQKVVKKNPEYAEIYYRLGIIGLKTPGKSLKKVMKHFKKAIKQNPKHVDAHYQMANLLNEALERPWKAISYFKKTLVLQADHPFANYDLALLYHHLGDIYKANKAYQKAIKKNPELRTRENDLAFAYNPKDFSNTMLAISPFDNEDDIRTDIRRLQQILKNRIKKSSLPEYTHSYNDIRELQDDLTFKTLPHSQGILPSESEKTVLITGATSGIGKATAEIFAQNGYRLILTGRRQKKLETLKERFKMHYNSDILTQTFDVRDYEAVKNAVEELTGKWGKIDILVNNAGLASGFDPIHKGKLEDWETMIDTNIKGLLYMTRLIAPKMVEQQKGHIVNVNSIAGKEVYPNGNVYCASKHAVEALTKGMRIDLHKHNIRVSQVSPGHVEETEFALVRFHGDKKKSKIYEDFLPVTSWDIANTIYFMTSQPPHVNIQDISIMGTQQANAMIVDRSGRD